MHPIQRRLLSGSVVGRAIAKCLRQKRRIGGRVLNHDECKGEQPHGGVFLS
jgi:hypothetical protein